MIIYLLIYHLLCMTPVHGTLSLTTGRQSFTQALLCSKKGIQNYVDYYFKVVHSYSNLTLNSVMVTQVYNLCSTDLE